MNDAVAVAVPPARKLGPRSRWSFGVGSIAYGIKDSGFATFLLLFYNQVVGLPSGAVGLAVGAALIVEAFVDPLVGYLSDQTRSRWGRRHPWMYASALPVALGWWLLWNPPDWEQGALLIYVFATALMVRVALSMFEIPSSALGPELSSDYDERTRLFSYRYLFGWGGGLVMLFLAYNVFLVPASADAIGLANNRDGYRLMALLASVAMAASIIASSIGLHHEIGRLPQAPREHSTLREHFALFGRTVGNKGFLVLMAAGLCAYTAQGVSFALSNYNYIFVWQLHRDAFRILPLALMVGAGIAFFIAPLLTRGGNKAGAAAWLSVANVLLIISPYVLRLLGLFPPPESMSALPLLLFIWMLNTACGVAAFILGAAMLADVVEESELRTGRRSEGVFFAGGFFVQKLCGGLGIFFAGLILQVAAFPQRAVSAVPVGTIDRMTLCFVAAMILFYGGGAIFYAFFPFGRAEHEARLKQAAVRIDSAMEGAIP